MNNIASCLLRWINNKGYYYQSYGNKNKMPEITILVYNCSVHKKNNLMIRFMNMIKQEGLFGTSTLNFYIKSYTKNDRDRAFNRLKVLYRKKNVFTFEKCFEVLNTRNNVEVIQIFHEYFF